jgi:hypothetical protein
MNPSRTGNSISVRDYRASDRQRVREVCCLTGFLGKPVDPLFQDRELFADYLTKYYTDCEPDMSIVAEKDGIVVGYILGSRFQQKQRTFDRWNNIKLAALGLWRYLFKYNTASRKFVRWIIAEGRHQIPYIPPDTAHFHINLLPEARALHHVHLLLDFFLRKLVNAGEKSVFGQMIVFEKRRSRKMLDRYGFQVLDQVEVTKYRDLVDYPVYLFTIHRNLENFSGYR